MPDLSTAVDIGESEEHGLTVQYRLMEFGSVALMHVERPRVIGLVAGQTSTAVVTRRFA